METRFIIFQCQENVGYSETYYSETQLEGKSITDVFSSIIAIVKTKEKVDEYLAKNRHLSYVEVEFEI